MDEFGCCVTAYVFAIKDFAGIDVRHIPYKSCGVDDRGSCPYTARDDWSRPEILAAQARGPAP